MPGGTRERVGGHIRLRHVVAQLAKAVVLPVVAGAFIWGGSTSLGPSVRAMQGNGALGTFVVTSHSCSKSCTWLGTFTSDDGTVVRQHVKYWDSLPAGTRDGDPIRAIDTGGDEVYRPTGSWSWVEGVVAIIVGLCIVAGWAKWYVVNGVRRRRFPTPEPVDLSRGTLAQSPVVRRPRMSRRAAVTGVVFAALALGSCGLASPFLFAFAALRLSGISRKALIALWVSAGVSASALTLFVLNVDAAAGTAGAGTATVALVILFAGAVGVSVMSMWVARKVAGRRQEQTQRLVP